LTEEYKEGNSFEMTGASEAVAVLREFAVMSSNEKHLSNNLMSKFAPKKQKLFEGS
jgi:hypothetical protein